MLVRRAGLIRWISAAAILIALVLLIRTLPTERVLGPVQEWVDSLGVWGPLALGAIYVVAALLLIPAWILTVAAGAIYGLILGTVIVSLASTTAVAVAFLVARYLAREKVRRRVEESPKLAAVDEAIGQQGWKIVALLRLSPAVPFNLQNYLYGVTAIRFWPCVLTSWIAMLPGTFLYVYLGSIGKTAAAGGETSVAQWIIRGIGLAATVAVTFYLAWLARNAIHKQTHIEEAEQPPQEPGDHSRQAGAVATGESDRPPAWPWPTLANAAAALLLLASAAWATARQDAVQRTVERFLGVPPKVAAVEAYQPRPGGPTFDHSTLSGLLEKHVDSAGWVDYQGLQNHTAELQQYLDRLADAPFEQLGRDEKLALLINAYNAFTLQLILEHYPLESIRDIPQQKRWEAERWQVGRHTWSLNQIEHEQIRPKFREPRIHFALVCAAVGCPPLRTEAYTGKRLEEQLTDQADYVHSHPRWFRFDPEREVVQLTKLYDWYRGDFTQQTASVLDYAARFSPELREALEAGRRPDIQWLKYDWRLNSQQNRPAGADS